jgi:hypothetical protein
MYRGSTQTRRSLIAGVRGASNSAKGGNGTLMLRRLDEAKESVPALVLRNRP